MSRANKGRVAPEAVIGAHVAQAWAPPPDDHDVLATLSGEDRAAFEAFQDYQNNHAAYATRRRRRLSPTPSTTPPVGLLAWNAQVMPA